jgi:hypothetical protein
MLALFGHACTFAAGSCSMICYKGSVKKVGWQGPELNPKLALRHFIFTLKEMSNLPVILMNKALTSESIF